jgi:hypothetical protein
MTLDEIAMPLSSSFSRRAPAMKSMVRAVRTEQKESVKADFDDYSYLED